MNLLPGSLPFGVAPRLLIRCAQQLHELEAAFSDEDFCKALAAPMSEALPVLQEMLSAGYLDRAEMDGLYTGTTLLSKLANANVSTGITRSRGDELLRRVVAKAREVNAAPAEHECTVEYIVVFGSYLTDKALLGDLDLGVELRDLPSTRRARFSLAESSAGLSTTARDVRLAPEAP